MLKNIVPFNDCSSDVFLVCDEGNGQKSYQIWLNKKSQGFVLATRGTLPTGTQTVSFADIGRLGPNLANTSCTHSSADRDGTIDMMFTTCKSVSSNGVGSDCYINIAYNQQLRLCSSATDSGMKDNVRVCRPPNDLCTADDNFEFDLRESPDNDVRLAYNTLPLTYLNSCRLSFASLCSQRAHLFSSPMRHLIHLFLSHCVSETPIWTVFPTFWR